MQHVAVSAFHSLEAVNKRNSLGLTGSGVGDWLVVVLDCERNLCLVSGRVCVSGNGQKAR